MAETEIILASASPRRRELLEDIGVRFRVVAAGVDESAARMEAADLVVTLARRKARAAARQMDGEKPGWSPPGGRRLIIGADTVVVCDGEILGKPRDPADAERMLQLLSGQSHRVLTGLALLLQEGHQPGPEEGQWSTGSEETEVRFAPLTPEQVRRYVASGEPLDKAGAYGIQGRAAVFVEGITGCYSNVVGLPLHRLYLLAGALGVELQGEEELGARQAL